jgi:hypothetical protein
MKRNGCKVDFIFCCLMFILCCFYVYFMFIIRLLMIVSCSDNVNSAIVEFINYDYLVLISDSLRRFMRLFLFLFCFRCRFVLFV